MSLHGVVLAGGRGERFWPLSRQSRPKQVLPLLGSRSLLEAAVERARARVGREGVWLAASEHHRSLLDGMSLDVPPDRWIWETVARNTAPALGACCERILEAGGGKMVVIPSDHWIPSTDAFWRSVDLGLRALDGAPDRVVTFGVPIAHPETGYGYVERGPALDPSGVFRVMRFHEKPDLETARAYASSGVHYWNSGLFVFDAGGLARLFRDLVPEMSAPLDELRESLRAGKPDWRRYFEACPSISIDYAVAERAKDVVVVEAGFEWSDLGSWPAWGERQAACDAGNRRRGSVLAHDAENCLLYSEDGGLLAVLGVKDLIVVRVGDATLVCPRERAQEVRRLVEEGKTDALLSRFF